MVIKKTGEVYILFCQNFWLDLYRPPCLSHEHSVHRNTHFFLVNFPGENEQTSLASQLIRILLLFSRLDLAMTGEQALQEPRASWITQCT